MTVDRRDFLKTCAVLPLLGLPTPRPARKLKILILGGTAFLGPHLVEAARAQGHTVTLFNRGRTRPDLFPDLEKLRGDRDGDLKSLEGRKFDGVIDTSAYFPRQVKLSAGLLKDSGHYTFVSTVSVYPNMGEADLDETSPVGKIPNEATEEVTNETYGPLKALCEQAAEAAMPGKVANVRPGLIVGPGDTSHRFTYWPERVRQGGEVLAPGKPEYGIQYIDVRDLAEWIIRLTEQKVTGVFNALGPVEPTPMGVLLETSKAVTKSDATFTWVSQEFLEEHRVAPWADLPAWVPPPSGMTRTAVVGNKRAIEKGLRFRALDKTIHDTLEWYAKEVGPESAPSESESRPRRRWRMTRARERGLLAAWHESQKK